MKNLKHLTGNTSTKNWFSLAVAYAGSLLDPTVQSRFCNHIQIDEAQSTHKKLEQVKFDRFSFDDLNIRVIK